MLRPSFLLWRGKLAATSVPRWRLSSARFLLVLRSRSPSRAASSSLTATAASDSLYRQDPPLLIFATRRLSHGCPLCSLAPDSSLRRRRLYRQLHHAHRSDLPPQRLPPTSRGRQTPGRLVRRWRAARFLHVPVQRQSQGDEVPGHGRKIQARPSRHDDRIPHRPAGNAQISRAVVRLLPDPKFLRSLSHRPHRSPRRPVPSRLPRGRHRRVPGLRPKPTKQQHLERPALERNPERSLRRPNLRPPNRSHLRLPLAALTPLGVGPPLPRFFRKC